MPYDTIRRGVKRPNPLGTAIFVGLRSFDPFIQYNILANGLGSGLLAKVGLEQLPAGLATNTGTIIDKLGLSPYRLILLSMSVGSALKHIFWLLTVSEEGFEPKSAIAVGLYNTFCNSINDLLFTSSIASASLASGQSFPQWPLIVGSLSYVIGITTETVAELQRKRFKKNNPGKPYTGGLWSLARHINYTGYALWRAGYTCAGGGFGAGLVMLIFTLVDFDRRSIVTLDKYCTDRYGAQWEDFKKKTPYKLIPYVY
ncbi:hypothetical protein, variant [Verruconis gallopava]|uniref:Delta(14)-sterol reductase n=1 Tax=Verruconis gallopava TaxID=253628 RepID=A0A0D1Z3A1_9PEZI|nr:uncharacterized protein PV09_02259 [Verruconis gallopava]XP_016217287.1 hypothetical protein, variant [Verruconis gallopava]KIW07417.1 hypothetical protein PV09_02259 [Verruconis gallopava]KIW07418.1 hypothetical protein, variant [Verruconis gallopava]